jgi:hypothetical protein
MKFSSLPQKVAIVYRHLDLSLMRGKSAEVESHIYLSFLFVVGSCIRDS